MNGDVSAEVASDLPTANATTTVLHIFCPSAPVRVALATVVGLQQIAMVLFYPPSLSMLLLPLLSWLAGWLPHGVVTEDAGEG